MSLEDAIKTLVNFVLIMEHLPRRRVVSLPPSGTNWANWSNALGREIYLHHALKKLKAEYPPESDCDFLTHQAPMADSSGST
jgi:hypothetical protein